MTIRSTVFLVALLGATICTGGEAVAPHLPRYEPPKKALSGTLWVVTYRNPGSMFHQFEPQTCYAYYDEPLTNCVAVWLERFDKMHPDVSVHAR